MYVIKVLLLLDALLCKISIEIVLLLWFIVCTFHVVSLLVWTSFVNLAAAILLKIFLV
jgi:hypothetical protein